MNFSLLKIIFIYLLLLSYKTQENKENDLEISDSNEEENIKEEINESIINSENISIDNDSMQNIESIEIESIDFGDDFKLADSEMDSILLCAYIAQYALKNKYQEDLQKIADKIDVNDTKKVYDKIGSEFTEICLSDIDNKTVNKYITNLTYHNNFEWEERFNSYTKIDYGKYNSKKDLKYTLDQQILLRLLKQSNLEFEKRKRERRNIREQEKMKKQNSFNKNVNSQESILIQNIWKEIKFFLGIIIILFTFFGILHFLKKIFSHKSKENTNEKNKKKKTE